MLLLKYLLNILFSSLFNFFTFKRIYAGNSLLIIKLDALGDFIIFNSFIKEISNSNLYKGYKITLLANELWAEYAKVKNDKYLHEVIPIKPKDYRKDKGDFNKLFKLCQYLSTKKYDVIINMHLSMNPLGETFACSISSNFKIGLDTKNDKNTGVALGLFKKGSNLFYDDLYYQFYNDEHETIRIKNFISYLLKSDITLNNAIKYGKNDRNNISTHLLNFGLVDKKYIILALGAGGENRTLKFERIKMLFEYIYKNTDFFLVFTGTNFENNLYSKFQNNTDNNFDRVINLCNKTNLLQLEFLVSQSSGVICYDSGIYHIAKKMNKLIFCIAGGGHFKRFVDYPVIDARTVLCYEKLDCYNCNWNCIYGNNGIESFYCIEKIANNKLLASIDVFLEACKYEN